MSQEISSVVTDYLLDVQPGLYKVLAATTGGNTDRYVHDIMGFHSQEDHNGNWSFTAPDHLGSVRAVYDDTLNEDYFTQYAPYGDPFGSVGSNPTSYGFTGEPIDSNGLVHLRARYYNPDLGNFISLDPLETANRYVYVNANPGNQIDPSGLIPVPEDFYDGCHQQNDCVDPPSGIAGRVTASLVKDGKVEFPYETISGSGIHLTIPCGFSDFPWQDGEIETIKQAIEDIAHRGNIQAFNNAEMRRVPVEKGYPAETQGGNLIEWYGVSNNNPLTNGLYQLRAGNTPLVVHELGHVLLQRKPEIFETATHYTHKDALEDAGRTIKDFWLPVPIAAFASPVYVQGSYDNPNSTFENEYLADSLVWWVYYSYAFIGEHPPERLVTFLNGGILEEDNGDGTVYIFKSSGMPEWAN